MHQISKVGVRTPPRRLRGILRISHVKCPWKNDVHTAINWLLSAGYIDSRNIRRHRPECDVPQMPQYRPSDVYIYFLDFIILKVRERNPFYFSTFPTHYYLHSSTSLSAQINLKIRFIGLGFTRHLLTKQVKLWVDAFVEFHYRLLVVNSIRAFQATVPVTDHWKIVMFWGIVVCRLLKNTELNQLRAHGTVERRAFVPGRTPNTPLHS